MSTRKCVNNPNVFCYVCGNFTVLQQRSDITDFVKKAYHAYFKMKLGDQDKAWAPKTVCRYCVERLRLWIQGKKPCMPFAIPMVWREPKDHLNDCYFCLVNVQGRNSKNKKHIVYPSIPSAIRPVPHGEDLPAPLPPAVLENLEENDVESELHTITDDDSDDVYRPEYDVTPQLFSQSELNDLVRDLNLPKESAELLGSRLKNKNLLEPGTHYSWYRHREQELVPFFSQIESLVYCNNINELMHFYDIEHDPAQWRLFIDSSKRSLKGVLLHNGNVYGSIPVAHSVQMKETFENMKILLRHIQYEEHKWLICGDFKVIGILLGQQAGFTKMPCFLCEWDSRAKQRHWSVKVWPQRRNLLPGTKNILHEPLVERQKILLPPLHIKLGLMKQFVRALPQDGPCFKYLSKKFPFITQDKLKAGIFVGPQIKKLMKDEEFEQTMNEREKEAWTAFRSVTEYFLGNNKDPNYKAIVETMLENFKKMGCNMSVKVHFLHSHIDYFPENLGHYSEEQGERFHQDIKEMERRYQGRWNETMMADYCWMLRRDSHLQGSARKSKKRKFEKN